MGGGGPELAGSWFWPRQVVQGLSVSGVKIPGHINFFYILFFLIEV